VIEQDLIHFAKIGTLPSALPDDELLNMHRRTHQLYGKWVKGGRKGSIEDVLNYHLLLVAEMKKRGFEHQEGDIDRELLRVLRRAEVLEEERKVEKAVSGLPLVAPHATWIMQGKKTMIVKARHLGVYVDRPLYLIEIIGDEEGLALGVIRLKPPHPILWKEFLALYPRHLISPEEAERWWGRRYQLYAYDFEILERFDEPKKVRVERGVQTYIKEVQFLSELEFAVPGMEGIDYDIKHRRQPQLIADHFYLHVGWNLLQAGKKWGEWTKRDIIEYHAKVVKALRDLGLEFKPRKESKLDMESEKLIGEV